MKNLRNILFAALCLCLALPAAAQQNLASKIVGIWTSPYKSSTQQGSLMLRFSSNGTMEIIRSVTIEDTPHAAFAEISGGWQVSGNTLAMTPKSTDAPLQWGAVVREQVVQGEIPRSKSDQLYDAAAAHLPRLNALHFASRMQIKQITESRLVLLNPKDSKTLTFTRLTAFPKGSKLRLPDPEPEPTPTELVMVETSEIIGRVPIVEDDVEMKVIEEKPTEEKPANPVPEKIFTAVEESPKFPGGDAAMYRWLASNIRYPEMAAQNNIQGRVTVQFVVEKDGSIGETKVVRAVDPDLNAEAVRVVKTMPKWIPAKMNGQPVRSWYTLPISFKLTK